MVIVTAELTIKDGLQKKFLEVVKSCIEATRKEAGNISYVLYAGLEDPCKFTFLEEWTSKEALDEHMKTEHFNAFGAEMKELAGAPMKLKVYEAKEIEA